jgi:uncharacterized membrane protein YheB (UPF0754 family)
MTTQPDALRLADWMENFNYPKMEESAAELRRLHEVNQELLEAFQTLVNMAELFANELHAGHPDVIAARAAIAKATGKQA